MALGKVGKIYIGWGCLVVVGLVSFIQAKRQVDKNRFEVMKSKQRIRDALKSDREEASRGIALKR